MSILLLLSDAEKEMAEWISCLVVKNQPFSVVDCPAMRKLTRLKLVSSSRSVRKHVLSLMLTVVKKKYIKQHLPSKFALVFDGWTEGSN